MPATKSSNNAQTTTQAYCRLFLATSDCFDRYEMETALKAAIAAGDIACLLLRHMDSDVLKDTALAVTKLAQDAGIAVLIEENIELALSCNADGVQVFGDISGYENARTKLGDDKIVGVYCNTDRHSAMSLGEKGADYVAFSNDAVAGENEPVAHWWARVFEVPCVVLDPVDLTKASVLISNKIDFIVPDGNMWSSAQNAKEAIVSYNKLIEETQIETN